MVGRVNDTPRTTNERIRDASTRLDTLSRAMARPTTALRNDAGHALDLTPQSALPMLVPSATTDDSSNTTIDSALLFRDGGLQVRDPTDTAYRDLNARAVGVTGNLVGQGDVNVAGNAIAQNVSAFGNVSGAWVHSTGNINADVSIGAGLNVIAGGNVQGASANFGPLVAGNTQVGTFTAGGCTTGDVFCLALNCTVFINRSDARLKERFRPVEESVLDRLLATPVQSWRWRQKRVWSERLGGWEDQTPDDREHLFPVAQDMPSELVVEGEDGGLGVDMLSTTGALLALVQRQSARIDALEQRLAGRDDSDV